MTVAKMCRLFKVSPSGYHEWLHNTESITRRENQAIYKVLKISYEKNKGRVGLDKLLADVREKFPKCSRNRLYKIQKEMVCSMIRTGVPYDNACAETFFSTIKLELIYHEHFRTQAQAQSAVFEYIEVYYNRQRRNAVIGNITPYEYRRRYLKKLIA